MSPSIINEDRLSALNLERDKVKAQIEPLQSRLTQLDRAIAMANELMSLADGAEPPVAVTRQPEASPMPEDQAAPHGGPTLVDAVPAVLRKFGPLKPARIRERLADVGFTSNYNDNYFYTVISRLSKSGAIVRTPDKQLAVPDVASASQGNGSAMH